MTMWHMQMATIYGLAFRPHSGMSSAVRPAQLRSRSDKVGRRPNSAFKFDAFRKKGFQPVLTAYALSIFVVRGELSDDIGRVAMHSSNADNSTIFRIAKRFATGVHYHALSISISELRSMVSNIGQ